MDIQSPEAWVGASHSRAAEASDTRGAAMPRHRGSHRGCLVVAGGAGTGVTSDRAHVLLVEDTASVRDLFARYLRWSGLDVTTAEDGNAALAHARTRTPDIVVCDIAMPNLDGVALCRALRSERATAALPIVVVSGADHLYHAVRDAGCDVVLPKPCLPADLLATIRQLLSRTSSAPAPLATAVPR